jgi:thioester reductase-like protein
MTRRILVTGAGGLLGRFVVDELLNGYAVSGRLVCPRRS